MTSSCAYYMLQGPICSKIACAIKFLLETVITVQTFNLSRGENVAVLILMVMVILFFAKHSVKWIFFEILSELYQKFDIIDVFGVKSPGTCDCGRLQQSHNYHYSDVIMSASNHRHCGCFLNRLFRRRSKKASKLRDTGLCVGNSSVTGEFPAQRASGKYFHLMTSS